MIATHARHHMTISSSKRARELLCAWPTADGVNAVLLKSGLLDKAGNDAVCLRSAVAHPEENTAVQTAAGRRWILDFLQNTRPWHGASLE